MASSSSSTAPTQSPPNPEGPFFSDFGITDSGEFYAKNNPFQRSGPVGATERIAMAKNDKVTYVRVDMPGVPKECQYLTTFPDNVVFCGGLAPMVCEGCQSSKASASSVTCASGASGATLMQPKLHHSAADNVSTEHQCTSDQARPFDDVAASAKVTNVKIEELTNCLTSESDIAQLKRIKSCVNMPKLRGCSIVGFVL